MVSLDPRTGEVLVMVGGRDYAASQVSLATGGSTGFQPGSSFKPIVLAEAFRQGIPTDALRPARERGSCPAAPAASAPSPTTTAPIEARSPCETPPSRRSIRSTPC
ncbi:MAG: penicillin-binding transpeptidase domain-containing protein [Acidimicrobiales bacterium]